MIHFVPLLSSLLIGSMGVAGENQQVELKLHYERDGDPLCKVQTELTLGETYLVCEVNRGENRIVVKTKVEKRQSRNVLVDTLIEEIDASKKVRIISHPRIQTTDGSEAGMMESDENGRVRMKMSVQATLIK